MKPKKKPKQERKPAQFKRFERLARAILKPVKPKGNKCRRVADLNRRGVCPSHAYET
jgi:hypothetical protein